jgi:ribonuclease HI
MTTERNLLFLEMVNKPVLKHDIQSIFFTDGSCKVTVRPGEDPIRLISAAIYQSQHGHNTAYKINADSWTNYGAELIAIWSTVHAARAGDRIMIISDSLSAIQAILYYKYKSIRNQIKKCFAWMIAQICEEILRVQVNNGCVHFFKVKSHVGIIGNMVADALADAAASEHFPMVLTPYEMIDLTASAACLIQIDHHERIHRPIYKTVISNTNSMLAKKALEKARLLDPPKEYTCLQIPIAVDEQGETIQSHTWLSTHLLDRGCYSSRPHFSELLASNRLRVCTRSKMDTPHTECPICHEECTCDLPHYLFECDGTADTRQLMLNKISTFKQQPNAAEFMSQIRQILAGTTSIRAYDYTSQLSICSYIAIGPHAEDPLITPTTQQQHQGPNSHSKEYKTEVKQFFNASLAAYKRDWKKHSEIFHEFYESIRNGT